MNNLELLKQRAEEFRILLDRYSSADADVASFYRKVLPLLNDVRDGIVVPPCRYMLRSYFSNPDFSILAQRYWNHELPNAEANFVQLLEGW